METAKNKATRSVEVGAELRDMLGTVWAGLITARDVAIGR